MEKKIDSEVTKKTSYYACLVEPFTNKYDEITGTDRKFPVPDEPDETLTEFYATFGADVKKEKVFYGTLATKANYSDDFTVLDYVKKYREILVNYGNGSAENIMVPCRLFKKTETTKTTIEEI